MLTRDLFAVANLLVMNCVTTTVIIIAYIQTVLNFMTEQVRLLLTETILSVLDSRTLQASLALYALLLATDVVRRYREKIL